MKHTGDALAELARRRRALDVAAADVLLARYEYHGIITKLHRDHGLSYGQISGLVGVTRSRVQQIVEAFEEDTTYTEVGEP